MTVDVLIPAYRPGEKFARLLSALRRQDTPVRKIIVVNTEEEYWDRRFERMDGLEVHHIKKKDSHIVHQNMETFLLVLHLLL